MIIGPYILSFWNWVIIIGFASIGACCVSTMAIGIIIGNAWAFCGGFVACVLYYWFILRKVFNN